MFLNSQNVLHALGIWPGSGGAVERYGVQMRTLHPDPASLHRGHGRIRYHRKRRVVHPLDSRGDGRGRRGDSDETCCWSVGLSHLPLAPSAASVDGQRPASPPRPHSLTPFGLSDAAFSGPLFSPRCRPPRSLPPQGNNTGRKKLLRFWMLTQRSLGATSCAPLSSANFSSKLGRCSSS